MFAIVSCTLFSFVVWPQLWPIHCCAQMLTDVATCSPIDGRLSSERSITVMQVLLLQMPRKQSKAKEHSDDLSRRLALCQKVQTLSLVGEGRCIQAPIPSSPSTKYEENLAKKLLS